MKFLLKPIKWEQIPVLKLHASSVCVPAGEVVHSSENKTVD